MTDFIDETMYSVLPVREAIVFPGVLTAVYVARHISKEAINVAVDSVHQQLIVLAQKDPEAEDVMLEDCHTLGVLASIKKVYELPDGTIKIILLGAQRVTVHETMGENPACIEARCEPVDADPLGETESMVYVNMIREKLDEFIQYETQKLTKSQCKKLMMIDDAEHLMEKVASLQLFRPEAQQALVALGDPHERFKELMTLLNQQVQMLTLEFSLKEKLKKQIDKSQEEYYLNHQMQVIQDKLSGGSELSQLEQAIQEKGMSKEATDKAMAELRKLRSMPTMSAEGTVIRQYLECLLSLPWGKYAPLKSDLKHAKAQLDKDHYGLDKIKTRILEFLAVQKRTKSLSGPIMCLVGPPGVGKTSLGKSLAKATGRPFVRISLGGVRDEADIRGHRKTYIGSMPGKIIQKLAKLDVSNPLIMLDEIDKMGSSHHGDPASALLEVLDTEQNDTFEDHYLEVGYDLSKVLFVATANSLDLPSPLLDRMEVIHLSTYTDQEKTAIAMQHLLPKQMKKHGLKEKEMHLSKGVIQAIIRQYTRESGVRSLERYLAQICRKVVKEFVIGNRQRKANIGVANLKRYIGPRQYLQERLPEENRVGQVNGLAWTEMGGELLTIEAVVMPGKGETKYTGSLGEVMQESIMTAMSLIRSRAHGFGLPAEFFYDHDFHIHVPEGATPKDGPSAGVGMCTALLSALTKRPVKSFVAMTGEITLRGEVLAIGGLKEKCLAAYNAGVRDILIPFENKKDDQDIPKIVHDHCQLHWVRQIDEVWDLALDPSSTGLPNPAMAAVVGQPAAATEI